MEVGSQVPVMVNRDAAGLPPKRLLPVDREYLL